jgi:Spy/CpxP family protein refolding chaperone
MSRRTSKYDTRTGIKTQVRSTPLLSIRSVDVPRKTSRQFRLQRRVQPLRLTVIALELFLAVSPLTAKDPPQATPTPDPALELSPEQDRAVQQINEYFDQNEKPIRATLKAARDEYNLALKAKPLDHSTVQAKAAAVQKATAVLAAAEALHRANVLTLLTPAQRKMVTTMELTGKVPGEKEDSKAGDRGH